MQPLLPTTLVGSCAQPDWLIDREKLAGRFPPRVRAQELWRVAPAYLEQAQDDATLLAIAEQEAAGLDIITDGEMRRESYSNRFATALEGVDMDNPGVALDRSGHPNPVPRVTGRIRRKHAVQVRDVEFLRRHTDRQIKITVPSPFTMAQQAQNDYYDSEQAMAMDYADCSVLTSLSEKTIMLGVLDLSTHEVESPDVLAARIRRALPFVDAARLVIAPDCGLKYLPRDVAFNNMCAMVEGTRQVRAELGAA